MKVVTVVGARPQFIKAASVSRAIALYNQQHITSPIHEILVHTGQHYDPNLSDVFFEEMQIPNPDYHLGIGGISQGAMTGRILEKIEEVIIKEQPDVVLVYGDTNSTLAGALAAVKLHIPVAHVEAGLRSFNMRMPEEVNRVLTDQISRWLFCPTETAVKNLKNEGILERGQVLVSNVGDVMYDAALFYRQIAKPTDAIACLINELNEPFYLATVHRAENTDDPVRLSNIMGALETISKTTPVVLPLHPRTRKLLGNQHLSRIRLIEPVGYFDMITLLSKCKGVFTDSGGLQKEAYFFHKPCITLREETEWVELVEYGFNTLVGSDPDKILSAQKSIGIRNRDDFKLLYGQGDASAKILKLLEESFQSTFSVA
ncbi:MULTISPECIES: non-hydrolyzing UDP-N-acetylglucosamine 2-epimerase [Cyanophyceae]|uniref:non-hydrolyzing UDP-N-acetylglucosamine 2-epimerase n=1 Tax=Cyanophyceae TaxID=3028117 RepID=UPI00168366A7|nr:UDP-N-acetylglucosamine 2-epimerase (non-hydrolyzing) [Trichocoleus sp. FACHB-69]MBD1933405.1 UDP-N-acetylglucosamine 2-epimerase (non-hydrolyzing) [Trichocoleus sp. FACHB-69]